MSTEALKWAMDDAPMLRTASGKPDSTARHVLQVLAEHAHADGAGAWPSVLKIQYRTGYDRRTVQRALRRLEADRLISSVGSKHDCTVWRLDLKRVRPASDMDDLRRQEEADRQAAAERKRRSRARAVTHSDDVTVTDSAPGRHALEVRDVTHSESGRHALSAALTTKEPSVEPPGNEPPDGRRPTTGSREPSTGGSAARQQPDQESITAATSILLATMPRPLRDQLEKAFDRIPRAVTDAIADELGRGVTSESLAERAERRWTAHGYALASDGGQPFLKPVGVAVALFRANSCTHPRCDDGTDLESGEPCRTCRRELEDRMRLAPVPEPSAPRQQRGEQPRQVNCAGPCGAPFPAHARVPADRLCLACRESDPPAVSPPLDAGLSAGTPETAVASMRGDLAAARQARTYRKTASA